jgi:DNA (cytosine-5)-methyltransferase 1
VAEAVGGVLELFAGLGNVAAGFADTGRFCMAGLVDVDPDAYETTCDNIRDVPYLNADLRQVSAEHLGRLTGGDGSVVGVLGCPPCQGFSSAGRRREDDERNELLDVYFEVVEQVRPSFFVMENVPAVLWTARYRSAFSRLSHDFALVHGVLNASQFGLPQTRQRAIVIGYSKSLGVSPTLPAPTHGGSRPIFDYRSGELVAPSHASLPGLLADCPVIGVPRKDVDSLRPRGVRPLNELSDFVTIAEAFDDLPAQGDIYEGPPKSTYASARRSGQTRVSNHVGWKHRPEVVKRLAAVQPGGVPSASFGRNKTYFSQAYGRLHPHGLARTVTTNFHNPGSGRFTHHAVPRTLTIREAARLQGFDDSWTFKGRLDVQERLVGNAFPRPWARTIGEHVLAEIGHLLET